MLSLLSIPTRQLEYFTMTNLFSFRHSNETNIGWSYPIHYLTALIVEPYANSSQLIISSISCILRIKDGFCFRFNCENYFHHLRTFEMLYSVRDIPSCSEMETDPHSTLADIVMWLMSNITLLFYIVSSMFSGILIVKHF